MPTVTDTATEELAQAVGLVFQTMLGVEATLVAPGLADGLPASAELMTAAVYLTGKQRGAVLIHCLPQQARAFAGRFLSSVDHAVGSGACHAVDDEEVLDVLGELANMVAGNLPCSLIPGSAISVPSVFEGPAAKLRICGSRASERTCFSTPSGPLWVTMVTTA